ncbi:ABC transporter ATP-binding protein [Micrococcus terreus]|uniref:ABC transporter ATP-binding protein n=1 Tax=Micrococcus terreus TaxID=574650 RepID=UPI00254F287C|nr:ABC transporter ATP-binding protein [Micrococcus terreus]MDK7700798.1 ABC transporter ATP-binding protein [Micrococcus terreus]WOO96956.1 ABC transporter ATP-binding protein [Micrococcus terreus]
MTNALPLPHRQGPPLLSALGLTKTYGTTRALDGVDLSIMPGESVAIMGPSGSGKTTLMHCLSGILVPDDGSVQLAAPGTSPVEITVYGEEERARLRREKLGFVFQEGLLLPELTAQENVALPLMLSGVGRAEAQDRARQWLGALGLDGMHERRLGELSGGQAQRVAIARAQVAEPLVVFADEPTGALDSTTSEQVLTALLDSTTGRGRTLVMVTHDQATADRCSRLVRVQDGRIVADSACGSRRSDGYATAHPAGGAR